MVIQGLYRKNGVKMLTPFFPRLALNRHWAIQKKKKSFSLYKTIQLYKDYVYLGMPPHLKNPHSDRYTDMMAK